MQNKQNKNHIKTHHNRIAGKENAEQILKVVRGKKSHFIQKNKNKWLEIYCLKLCTSEDSGATYLKWLK